MPPLKLDQIKTIVIVMMENRSFDHMLGYLALPQYGGFKVEGLKDDAGWRKSIASRYGDATFPPWHDSNPFRTLPADPPHEREDIKLFVKLPSWFQVDTPVGKYNPDWAIVKHDGQALYLVRETKGTRDFLKLRSSEADKVRCGQRHFEAIGVPFAVAVSADEV